MTKKSIGYVELEWVCPNCETRNPGPQKFCNGCGAAQPHDVDFEQALEEEILTDEEQIARAQAGPDIHCPYCGARNAGDAKFCGACGGDLSSAEARKSGQVVGAHRHEPGEEVQCPSYGMANPATNKSCTNCGAQLEKEISPRTYKCTKCGQEGTPADRDPGRGNSLRISSCRDFLSLHPD